MIMKKIFKISPLILLMFSGCNNSKSTTQNSQEANKNLNAVTNIPQKLDSGKYVGESITKLMPINATLKEGERINLVVTVPKGYKCLQENLMDTFLEFIPQTDTDSYKWSEIITTVMYLGKCLKAEQIIDSLKNFIIKDDPSAKILDEATENKDVYKSGSVTIMYTSNNRKEVMFAKYFAGPYDCSGFQYSIALEDKKPLAYALKRIKDFIEKNTFISKF